MKNPVSVERDDTCLDFIKMKSKDATAPYLRAHTEYYLTFIIRRGYKCGIHCHWILIQWTDMDGVGQEMCGLGHSLTLSYTLTLTVFVLCESESTSVRE